MPEHLPDSSTTRRTLLRTAAWSVPAVSLAAATPAFAGSSPDTLLLQASGMWFENTEAGQLVARVDFEIVNASAGRVSTNASVVLDVSSVPHPPAGLETMAQVIGGEWRGGWVKPVGWQPVQPEYPNLVVTTHITDDTVAFSHAGGIPAGGKSPTLGLIIFGSDQVTSRPTLPVSLVPSGGWGVDASSASQVTWQEV